MPHNKTSYELIRGRPPLIDFMKPFGCPDTILNTRDNLGKFKGNADEGYFVGYSVVRNRPDRLFDIDSLTISMNYVPVDSRNQTNGIAGSKENLVAGQDDTKKALEQEYILIPICTTDPLLSQGSKDNTVDAGKKALKEDESEASNNGGKNDQVSINDTGIFGNAYDDEVLKEEVDMNNVDSSYTIPEATKFLKNHPQEQVSRSLETPVQRGKMSNTHEEFGLLSSVHKLRRTNHKDFQN
nr:retrovirus-related Pol polyprotein from transposon TNT 1-94 [Tanacetum cinerariifolium]